VIYEFANQDDLQAITALLNVCKLPANDLEAHEFIVAKDGARVVGSIGLELEGPLLRSMAVDPAFRNQGIASELCRRILQRAQKQNLTEIYLITDTAEAFFQRIGFHRIERHDAPESIRAHPQFTTLCPVSALVMRKNL
jgi:amino-acid N-acetyltransferase